MRLFFIYSVFIFGSLVSSARAPKADYKPVGIEKTPTVNTSTCQNVLDSFLKNRKLLSADGKLSPDVQTVTSKGLTPNKQPKVSLTLMSNPKVKIETDEFEKEVPPDVVWTLTLKTPTDLPAFERGMALGTEAERAQDGSYTRVYKFSLVNNFCVLKSVDSTFYPIDKPAGETSDRLIKSECDYLVGPSDTPNYIKNISKRPNHRTLAVAICKENANYFYPPAIVPVGKTGRGVITHTGSRNADPP